MHNGTLRLDQSGRFEGMVNGALIVGSGVDVVMAGMVNGSLVVEQGATVEVTGMVNGPVINHGGRIDGAGMFQD